MILVLIAGIACFALTGLQLTRAQTLAERELRLALETVRAGGLASAPEAVKKEWLSARALAALARLHTRIWPKESAAEVKVWMPRQQALRNLAARVDSEEVSAFVNAVLSSEQLGSPLSAILRSQAADCRHRRRMHAEESAQKAPVKMLFPIVLFIFLVMGVVILGPAILGSHGLL